MDSRRDSWDDSGMLAAYSMARRSTCCHHKVGCAIVSGDHLIIGQGYNGAASGKDHCIDVGCRKLYQGGRCIGLHAEANAIKHSQEEKLPGSTLYSTIRPCIDCANLIVEAGILRVVYNAPYIRVSTGDDGRKNDRDEVLSFFDRNSVEIDRYEPGNDNARVLIVVHKALLKDELSSKKLLDFLSQASIEG